MKECWGMELVYRYCSGEKCFLNHISHVVKTIYTWLSAHISRRLPDVRANAWRRRGWVEIWVSCHIPWWNLAITYTLICESKVNADCKTEKHHWNEVERKWQTSQAPTSIFHPKHPHQINLCYHKHSELANLCILYTSIEHSKQFVGN